jgi:hypothetical protein
LTQLGSKRTKSASVAAETGGTTTMVAGTGEGKVLMARTLSGNWNDEMERLAVDLNRTVLFVNQQYGVTINKGLGSSATGAEQKSDALQDLIPLPVDESPSSTNPFTGPPRPSNSGPKATPNLISREQRGAPKRRVFAGVVGFATVLVMGIALAAAASVPAPGPARSRQRRLPQKQMTKMRRPRSRWRNSIRELSRKKQLSNSSSAIGRLPPPPGSWPTSAKPFPLTSSSPISRSPQRGFYTVVVGGTFQAPLTLVNRSPTNRRSRRRA